MEIFPNWTAIPVVVLLLIFLFSLKRVFFDPLRKTLEERSSRIEGARHEAEEIHRVSQDRVSDVDRRMRDARRESDAHMAQLRNQALNEKGQIVGARRSETEKLLSEAKQELKNKTAKAGEELRAQSQDFARQIASRILKRPLQGKSART